MTEDERNEQIQAWLRMSLAELRQELDEGRLTLGEAQLHGYLERALERAHPAVAVAASAALAGGRGKKAVVAAAVVAACDGTDPDTALRHLATVTAARSWADAEQALSSLGFAGDVLQMPQKCGLQLPAAAHAFCASGGTNWGLPNVRAAAGLAAAQIGRRKG